MDNLFLEVAEASLFIRLSTLKKRNIQIGDKRTSVTLEPQVWKILHEVANEQSVDVHDLCAFIDKRKHPKSSLASAIRVYLISYLHIKTQKKTP